uniref:Putative terminase n=1 Tax=viral metagenome TaxID=1070528 RepID=A0A6M3IR96_9ZZZZ
MASPLYHRSYGDLLPKTGDTERWTTYEKHLPHRPVYIRDPTLIALSPDSGTPGYGADLILMDDIVSQANSSSPTMRKHISQWVAGSLLKRLEPDGKFLVIGNRFYPQDYYGEILETKPHWKKLIYTSTPEEPLWPDHWDGAAIQSQRDDDPIFYHGQYLMEPLDLAAAGNFNSEWFQFYTALPPLLSIFSGIDLPITADIGTSKYAEVTMGRDPHGNLYLLDGYSGYHDGDELPTLMDALYRKWQPIEVAWESNGPQATVMKLSAKLVETDVRFYGIPSEIGKDRRLASIAGLVRTGKILVRGVVNEAGKIEPVGIAKVLLKAWDDFPTGDLDLLDAFEKCVCLARKSPPPASASTSGRTIEEQKIAQKQREEKRRARHPRNSKSRYPRVFR